jgi:hypothetical protein
MGKEKSGAIIYSTPQIMQRTFVNNTSLLLDLAKHWTTTSSYLSKEELIEDGCIQVTLKIADVETTIAITGLPNEGNKQDSLVSLLKQRKIITRGEKIRSILIYKNFLWNTFNGSTETFRSGDRLMIFVDSKNQATKKTIKHIPQNEWSQSIKKSALAKS